MAATLAFTSPAAAAPGPSVVPAPSRGSGSTVARIVVPVEARSAPGSGHRVWHVGTATSWTAQPQVLLVLDSAEVDEREWLRVLLPIRPVGAAGWIPRDVVELGSTPYWVTVDRSARGNTR